ncbi:hypothetical protein GCM10023322_31890 [Rugosimonospora acidiphila]|uniref:Ricin B lectin domain-containing protein n=1 Tax=Rugosimonospora acidiphila TaxID=556531 RepID=A0ABP9RTG3_9ACTN
MIRIGLVVGLVVLGAVVSPVRSGAASAAALPGASSTPNILVNFSTPVQKIDPAAIGADETAFGAPDFAEDPAEQQLLKTLGLGYSRIPLIYQTPGDPGSPIVCEPAYCDTAITGDQWIAGQRAVGESPIVQIGDTTSTADAAAMVAHFNVGGANPVHQWIIGNEPDGHGETAATYSARFDALADAMKAVDPTILIGGGTTNTYDSAFLRPFLQVSGSRVDFVDFHFYPERPTSPLTQAQLVGELNNLSTYLTSMRTLINTVVPSRASQIAIHVGEWNISTALMADDFAGFASVWDAAALGRILAAGDDSMMYATKNGGLGLVADGLNMAAGYSEDTPMPSYEAMSMFTGAGLFPHFGTTLVSATSSLAGVEVHASSGQDNIVLINENATAKNAVIHLANGQRRTMTAWQINQTGPVAAAPRQVATTTTINGTFDVALPALSVTTLVVGAPGAAASHFTFHDASTGRCLDSTTAGVASTGTCGGGNTQNWKVVGTTLVDAQTGLCLDSSAAGSAYTRVCNAGNNQNWYSLGSLLVDAQTGRCLDSNAAGTALTSVCSGAATQNWNVT